jgi:hypothetical protein
MKKNEVYEALENLKAKNTSMILIDDEKILSYRDINDDILGLNNFDEDEETEYNSFEIVEELENNRFQKRTDGTMLETKIFNPFGGMIIGYKII